MKRRTILLLAGCCLLVFYTFSYRQLPTAALLSSSSFEDTNHAIDLNVPDIVISHLSPYHQGIPTTGVKMIAPDGYATTINFEGFKRDKDTSITVKENSANSFKAKEKEVNDFVTAIMKFPSLNIALLYKKDFKFNSYDAMMLCVADKTSNRIALYMTYGNDRFNVELKGIYRDNESCTMQQIAEAFLTSCYKEKA